MREFHQDNLNPSLMIRINHLGESSVLNLHNSYIELNACFKFGGDILRGILLF